MRQIALFGMLVLAGCAARPGAFGDIFSYDIKSLTYVKMPDDTYRLYEHPNRDRIMSTPSLGASFGQGVVRGATLGLGNADTPEQRHEAAVRQHLDNTGRAHCKITSGYLLVTPQYEFRIDCSQPSQATAPSTEI